MLRVYDDDMQGQLYRTKLIYDHVYLTPSSTMNVCLLGTTGTLHLITLTFLQYLPYLCIIFSYLFISGFKPLTIQGHVCELWPRNDGNIQGPSASDMK